MDLASRDQFNELETEKSLTLGLAALFAELADSSASPHEVFGELSQADLAKPILWPEWPARTIGANVPYIANHEAEHLAQIRDALAPGP
jgi:hypothetical protein